MENTLPNLSGAWLGDTFGSHRLNVYSEVLQENDALTVKLHVAPIGGSGQTGVFSGNGKLEGKEFSVALKAESADPNVVVTGEVKLTIRNADAMDGTWEMSDGSKGKIQLSRYRTPADASNRKSLQLITKEHSFGALRITRTDIEQLIQVLGQLITGAEVIVTEVSKRNTIRLFSKEYLERQPTADVIDSLIFSIDQNTTDLRNSISVNLNRVGESKIFAQSPDQRWARNTASELQELIEAKSNWVLEFYRKYGTNINGLIFLILLVILPGLSLQGRIAWTFSVVVFLSMHLAIYRKASQTIITIAAPKKRKSVREAFPTTFYLFSTVATAILSVAAKLLAEPVIAKILALISQTTP
jgi:hypothetical protein